MHNLQGSSSSCILKEEIMRGIKGVLTVILSLTLVLGYSSPLISYASLGELEGTLTIFHAGSLTIPFEELSDEFEDLNPGIKVERESSGSLTAIRKVTELGRECDIAASADYKAIEELMFPDFAEFYICFAGNQMVIAYTSESNFASEIDEDNWYEILPQEGVRYGHSNPDTDPCGYRTLMVWQLAEEYYEEPGLYERLEENCDIIRPVSVGLIALLEAGELDYAFEYRSVARQHDLEFLELPPEIDLSSLEFEDFYSKAEVEVAGGRPGETVTISGESIVYGITVPIDAPHPDLAIAFIDD
jgi:molybdate/tungstate transport system substrate-binding protein